jgi:hypothetical protein
MSKTSDRSERRKQRLEIVYRAIEEIKPDPANARQHSRKQIRQLASSIATFGFNVPVLVDAELNAIAGHCRLASCHALGLAEVPTLCLDHLSRAQARAFMIADNRLTEIASWDDRLLAQQLKDLSLAGLDFSLEVTGFEMAEIDLRIESLEHPPEADDDPADALPGLLANPPFSKIGDLWTLGNNRVLCGSALDAAAFATLMGDERAATIFTDTPYNVPIVGQRPRRDPPSPLPDGLGRDDQDRIHRLSRPGFPKPRRVQRRRLVALRLHGLASSRRAAGGWTRGLQ